MFEFKEFDINGNLISPSPPKDDFVVHHRGIPQLGLELSSPYGKEFPNAILLSNSGKHCIVSLMVLYHGLVRQEARSKYRGPISEQIFIYGRIPYPEMMDGRMVASEFKIIPRLLKPGEAMLTGFGFGQAYHLPISNIARELPPVEEFEYAKSSMGDLGDYRSMTTWLTAGLDDSRIIGHHVERMIKERKGMYVGIREGEV